MYYFHPEVDAYQCQNQQDHWGNFVLIKLFLPFQNHMKHNISFVTYYRQTSNISRTLVGNQIVGHSDVVGAYCLAALLQLHLHFRTPGFNGLYKNCKTRRETLKLRDLVRLMLHIWRYMSHEICFVALCFVMGRVSVLSWFILSIFFMSAS